MSKPKRILIVADISSRPAKMFLDQATRLAKGLLRLGNDVRLFSYCNALAQVSFSKSRKVAAYLFKSRVDKLLADYVRNYCPDFVFVGFAKVLDGETVMRMREAASKAVFIGIDGDPWPQLQTGRVETAKKLDIVAATNDGEFLQVYRGAAIGLCAFMPNMCDPDTDYLYEVADRWKSEILWTGKAGHHAEPGQTLRSQLVSELAGRANCVLYACYGRPAVVGINYLYAISGARIGANANSCKPVRLYSSDRLTHYLACGTFVLAERMPDGDLLFEDGRHLRYFDSVEQFFELAEWYLNHETERKKIADAGMDHVHKEFNSVKIAGYLLDLIDKGTYSAPWSSQT